MAVVGDLPRLADETLTREWLLSRQQLAGLFYALAVQQFFRARSPRLLHPYCTGEKI